MECTVLLPAAFSNLFLPLPIHLKNLWCSIKKLIYLDKTIAGHNIVTCYLLLLHCYSWLVTVTSKLVAVTRSKQTWDYTGIRGPARLTSTKITCTRLIRRETVTLYQRQWLCTYMQSWANTLIYWSARRQRQYFRPMIESSKNRKFSKKFSKRFKQKHRPKSWHLFEIVKWS